MRPAIPGAARPSETHHERSQSTEAIRHVGSLVKFSHTVFALPFALSAVVLALPFAEVTWFKVGLIVLCIAAARTAAMAFNRLVDRDIDAAEPAHQGPRDPARCAQRGLRAHAGARFVLVFLAGAALLGRLPLMLSPVALGLALGYSYVKRFSSLCHLVLGAAHRVRARAAPGSRLGAPVTLAPWLLVFGRGELGGRLRRAVLAAGRGFRSRAGLHSIPARFGARRGAVDQRRSARGHRGLPGRGGTFARPRHRRTSPGQRWSRASSSTSTRS